MEEGSDSNLGRYFIHRAFFRRYPLMIGLFFALFFFVLIATYMSPKIYQSSALVQINPLGIELNVLKKNSQKQMTGSFFTNELEAFTSHIVLEKVVRKLNLDYEWQTSVASATKSLSSLCKTKLKLGTDIIELKAKAKNPALAKEITEEIIVSYEEWANERNRKRVERELNVFRNNLENQRFRVLEKRRVLNMLSQALQVPYYESTRAAGSLGVIEENLLNQAENQYFALQKEKTDLMVHIETLDSLKDNELMNYAVGLEIPENRVSSLYELYQQELRSLESLKSSGLGHHHPNLSMQRSNIAKLEEDLKNAVNSLRKILETRLDLVNQQYLRMKKIVSNKKDEAVSIALEAHDYGEAKREYQHSVAILQEMDIEFLREKINLEIPKQFILVHKYPKENKNPVFPKVSLNITLGLFLSLALSVFIPFLLEYLDSSIKTFEDVEIFLNLPVFGVIPNESTYSLLLEADDIAGSESFRIIRSNIESKMLPDKCNIIQLISASKGEGKSTITSNLGYTFAKSGFKTLIIDCDFRAPKQHSYFKINQDFSGLQSYLSKEVDLSKLVYRFSENLHVIPADRGGKEEIFHRINKDSISRLFNEMKKEYDVIFVDIPPVMGFGEVTTLMSQSDLAVLIVEYGKLPKKVLLRAKKIAEENTQIAGVIINKADIISEIDYSYYYKGYYLYYYGNDEKNEENDENVLEENDEKI